MSGGIFLEMMELMSWAFVRDKFFGDEYFSSREGGHFHGGNVLRNVPGLSGEGVWVIMQDCKITSLSTCSGLWL